MKRVMLGIVISLLGLPTYAAVNSGALEGPMLFETFYSPVSMGRGMTGVAAENTLADAIGNPASFRQKKYFNITFSAQRNPAEIPLFDSHSSTHAIAHHRNFLFGVGVKSHKFLDVGIAYLVPYSGQYRIKDVTTVELIDDELVSIGTSTYRLSERQEQIAVPIKLNLNEFFSVGLILSYFKYTQKVKRDYDTVYKAQSQYWHPTFGFLWDVSPRLLIGGRYKPRVKASISDSNEQDLSNLVMPEERALGFQLVISHNLRLYGEGVYKRYTDFASDGYDNVTDYHIGYEYLPAKPITFRLGHFTRNNILIDTSSAKSNHQSYLTAGLSLHLGSRIDLNVGYIDGDIIDASDIKKAHVNAGVEIKI